MTKTTKLGATGPDVFPIALGCMGMSGIYGESTDQESIATIHRALERGVNLIDTGDFYAMGHNELLVGRALAGKRDKAVVSVKFGAMRGPDNSWGGVDTRPAALMNFLAYSLVRLGVDHVYRDPGGFRVVLRLKQKSRLVSMSSVTVQVRAGAGQGE